MSELTRERCREIAMNLLQAVTPDQIFTFPTLLLVILLTAVPWVMADSVLPSAVDICGTSPTKTMKLCELPYAFTYDEKTQLWNRAGDPKCLAKMESAMRAMDPWVDEEGGRKLYPDFITSYRLWQSVKRECWKGDR